ncbi:MAG: ROK family glucokinase [Ruminococcus sp.]|jgi:glucokinase|nr:ROK family glucokinase [Ruminococcus sp.]
MDKKYYIGIDLGGTNIKAGIVDENYNITAKSSRRTNCPRPASEIVADMVLTAKDAVAKAGLTLTDIKSVGIGSPGIANSKTGVVEYSNNLGFKDVPVAEMVSEAMGLPVFIENDANAAAYGEFLSGAAKGAVNAVCITLGTGVGGGIIIDGKIYSGSNFAGAEIGHSVVEFGGPQCSCGRRGCFEVFSSATGLIRMTKIALEENSDTAMHEWTEKNGGGKISARTAFECAKNGDKVAGEVVDKYIKYLACGIANVINIFQPDLLCIGGGVCNEGDYLLNPLKELVKSEIYTKNSEKNTEIVIAELGNDAGIIGAALLS